jgi:hypothetical protein
LTKTKDELGEEILERSLMFLLCAWVWVQANLFSH